MNASLLLNLRPRKLVLDVMSPCFNCQVRSDVCQNIEKFGIFGLLFLLPECMLYINYILDDTYEWIQCIMYHMNISEKSACVPRKSITST